MKTSDITDREVCEAVQAFRDELEKHGPGHGEYPNARLVRIFSVTEDVAGSAIRRSIRRGFVEWSTRIGLLTEKGRALLDRKP